MVNKQLKVNWDEIARDQLKEVFEYIRKDSEQNALKVKNKIIAAAKSLPEQPFRFPPDKNKDDNDGSYRAFLIYKYRVAYRVLEGEIRILRVRSDNQEPLSY